MAEPWESDPVAEEEPPPPPPPVEAAQQPWSQDPVVEQAAPVTQSRSAPESPSAVATEAAQAAPDLGPITRNAGEALAETASGFIPKTVGQLGELAAGTFAPAVQAVRDIGTTGQSLYDVLFGGKSIEETNVANRPEAATLSEVDKTPAFSKERFKAGFDVLAQVGMAAAVGRGLQPKPSLHEVITGERVEPEIPVAATERTAASPLVEQVNEGLKGGGTASETPPTVVEAVPAGTGEAQPLTQEKIAETAFRSPSGEIVKTGVIHGREPIAGEEAGFITNTGRFVGREEGFDLAKRNRQIPDEFSREEEYRAKEESRNPELVGEDIFPSSPHNLETPEARQGTEAQPPQEVAPTEVTPTTTEATPVQAGAEPQKVTSIKNEQVDAERTARGQPPIMSEASKDFGEAWTEFENKQAADSGYQDRLITELKEKPRAMTDTEVAAVTHKQVELNNNFDKVATELADAHAKGDTARVSELQAGVDDSLTKLNELNEITKGAGTESGRGLNARKMLVAEDYSLARMALKKTAAKGGEALTPAELSTIKGQSRNIDTLVKKVLRLEQQAVKRTEKLATETRIRTATGAFEKQKPPTYSSEQLDFARADLELAKRDFQKSLEKDRWARMTVFQKTKGYTAHAYDTARLLMTTGEFSFILRQGKIASLAHPIRTARAIPDTIRSMRSERVAESIHQRILKDPDYKPAIRDGLYIAERDAKPSRQEEVTMGEWTEHIPVVSAFNRAATTFLNKTRMDTYKALKNSIPPEHRTPENTKQFAMFANESTGRGGLGFAEQAAIPLARTFFSPRYLASRFQLALGHSLWGGTNVARSAIAMEYGRALIGLGVYYTAMKTVLDKTGTPAEIDWDSRSANFGKIRLGNTWFDPLAGFAQVATYGGRTITGETKTQKGDIKPIRGKVPYGGDDWWDITGRFARTKLHPVPGSIANLLTGRDLAGNSVKPEVESAKLLAPITYMDVYAAMKAQDLPTATALGLLAFLGEGLQTRMPKQTEAETKEYKAPRYQ